MINSISFWGITFHLYGLIIGVAMATAYTLTKTLVRQLYPQGEITQSDVDKSFWWLLGGGLIGARLYHVGDYWQYYAVHLGEIPAVWNGGLGIYGAIGGGLAGAICYVRLAHQAGKDRKRKFFYLVDAVAISLPLAQAIGRWGNFLNQEIYGTATNLPWKIFIDPAHRLPGYEQVAYYHPVFFYEMVWNLVGFVWLWRLGRGRKLMIGKGNYVALYLFWYAAGRTLLEPLKITLLESSKTMALGVGMVIMVTMAGFYIYRKKHHEWTFLAD